MMETVMTEFQFGDKVKVAGERGTVYVVKRTEPYADGSLLLFGGSTNPNRNQRFRNVDPSKLTLVSRRKGS